VVSGSWGWPFADFYTAKYGATDGAMLWERRYDGPTSGYDAAIGIAVDTNDDVIVTGSSHNGSNADIYTARYAAQDGALLWQSLYNGQGNTNDAPTAVAVDLSGNVVVTYLSSDSPANVKHYVSKHAAGDGRLLWEQRCDGPTNSAFSVRALAVDALGNVVVTGFSYGTNSDNDYYTAKYAQTDGALLWGRRNSQGAFATDVTVDSNGNVVVTGSSKGYPWNSDFYTAKYAPTDGAVLWDRHYDGLLYFVASDSAYPVGVAIDTDGNVLVAGSSYIAKYEETDGALLWEHRWSEAYAQDMALDSSDNVILAGSRTIKFSGVDGSVLWEIERGGSVVALDRDGNVVVAGDAGFGKFAADDGALVWESTSIGNLTAVTVDLNSDVILTGIVREGSTTRAYTVKCASTDGSVLWERYAPTNSSLGAVAVDGRGNVVVTGHSEAEWRNTPLYTAKYAAADGELIWERRHYGSALSENHGQAVVVDPSGDVVVTANSEFPCWFCFSGEVYTAKYAAVDGALLWEQRFNGYNGARGVGLDSSANVVVAGYAGGGLCDQAACWFDGDYYVAKYAAANGSLLWEQRYNGPADGDDGPHSFAMGSDGAIAITGETATVKYVMTQVTYPTPILLSLSFTPEGARLRFTGDAGRTYRLQRASDPAGPWSTFATLTAPPDGAVEHLDTAPLCCSQMYFYRVAAP
jgi:hypothetical protein